MSKRSLILHPFLFAIYPVASTLANNIDSFSPSEVIRPILVILPITGLVLFCTNLLIKNIHRAGLLTTMCVILLFYLGSSYNVPPRFSFGAITVSRPVIFLFFWGLATVILSHPKIWQQVRPYIISRYLNIMAAIPLLVPLWIIGNFFVQLPQDPLYSWEKAQFDVNRLLNDEASSRPDIYYIILDGYGNNLVLQNLYDFDNTEFIHDLQAKGFFVAESSHSNYPQTGLSLASSLNFEYLEDFQGVDSSNRYPMRDMIRHSNTRQILEAMGYSIISLSSGFLLTEIDDADIYINTRGYPYSEFESMLLSLSSIKYLDEIGLSSIPHFGYNNHRRQILSGFEALAEIAPQPGPKFVFAHLLAPHPPFVFLPDGTPVEANWDYKLSDGSHFDGTPEQYIAGYRDQIQYINLLVKNTVEQILENSAAPPIIILQADHGPGAYLDYESLEHTCIPERFSILNAYYFPGQNAEFFYASITPVNTFRILFDNYFNTNLGLIEDRSYYATWSRPYDFIDVTDMGWAGCGTEQ